MSSLIRDLAASTPEMLAAFGDEALLRAALAFEAALASAQAAEGLLEADEASTIADACATAPDIAEIATAAAHAGTLAIPLVAVLRERVAMTSASAAKKVHLGATSQDLADTAVMLQARTGCALLSYDGLRLADALAALAQAHARTPVLGRTLLQPARPISFGLRATNWLLSVEGALQRLDREGGAALMLQFGGAVGAMHGLDGKGPAVASRLAKMLGLGLPPTPWHSRRDGVAGLASALAILTGALGKLGGDIALMAQPEVGEAFEPAVAGRNGSSAMPHKRNPTGCQVARSAALRAGPLAATLLIGQGQEYERGLGGWQTEAPVLAELFEIAHGAIAAMVQVIEGLEVHPERMEANLGSSGLGADMGEAPALVDDALRAWRLRR